MGTLKGYGIEKLTGMPGTPFNRMPGFTRVPPLDRSVIKESKRPAENLSRGLLRRLLTAVMRKG